MTLPLENRIAFVTGATSGFGAACAERLARDGARVVVAARRQDRLAEMARRIGERALPIVLDVRDREAVLAAVAGLPKDFAAVDILVNNAGLALGTEPAHQASLDEWDTMIDTNCRGLVTCTRALLPGMVERDRGHVVNVGSVSAKYPYPGGNVYGGTKAFVHQFSLGLRSDLLGTKVRVTVIEPGMAETEFFLVRTRGDAGRSKANYRGVHALSGADVADAIAWCVSRPPHVNVNVLEVMPVQQAFGPLGIHRQE